MKHLLWKKIMVLLAAYSAAILINSGTPSVYVSATDIDTPVSETVAKEIPHPEETEAESPNSDDGYIPNPLD